MANIPVTGGSGYTVATEQIASVEYQKIKIVGGETGSTSVMGVTPDGSIKVSVIGTLAVAQSGTVISSISGTVNSSVSGVVNIGSVIGSIPLYAQPDSFVSGVTSIVTGTTAVSVLAAAGASLRNYITQVTVTNAAAVGTFVDIKDSGANILHSGYAAASGGGFAATFPVPIKQPTTNASIDVISRSQASIIAAVSGYKAA